MSFRNIKRLKVMTGSLKTCHTASALCMAKFKWAEAW